MATLKEAVGVVVVVVFAIDLTGVPCGTLLSSSINGGSEIKRWRLLECVVVVEFVVSSLSLMVLIGNDIDSDSDSF